MDDEASAAGDLLRPIPLTKARVIRFSADEAHVQPERPDQSSTRSHPPNVGTISRTQDTSSRRRKML